MKKILVLSDTHNNRINIDRALKKFNDYDSIIHLGDHTKDADYIKTLTHKKVYSVRGNCDLYSTSPKEIVVNAEGVKILAVHGHKQGVKMSLLRLGLHAAENQADIALFGHTHIPTEELFQNVILFNPGSLGEPRGRRPSVGIITIDGNKLKAAFGRL